MSTAHVTCVIALVPCVRLPADWSLSLLGCRSDRETKLELLQEQGKSYIKQRMSRLCSPLPFPATTIQALVGYYSSKPESAQQMTQAPDSF